MNFLTTGFSLVFPLITFPYVTRVLTADGYGDYEFANSTANMFLLIAQLGVGLYGTRECAKVRDDPKKLAQVSKELFWVTAIAGFATSIIYVGVVVSVPAFEQRALLMLICGLTIPFTVLGVNWFFSGTEQFLYVAVRTLAVRIVVLIGMFAFVRTPSDCVKWAAVSVLANSGAYVINFVKMRRGLPWESTAPVALKRHLKPMFRFFLAMASISLYSSFGSVLLGLLSTSVEVGYFAAALKIKSILIAIVMSLTGVLVSRASYYIGTNDSASYNTIVGKAMCFVSIVVVSCALYIFAFAESIVRLLAGSGFESAVLSVRMMMVAAIAIGFSSITANVVLTPMGKERLLTYSYLFAGVVGAVLNLILIPRIGAVGAAIGTATAEVMVLVVQLVFIQTGTRLVFSTLFSGVGKCAGPVLVGGLTVFLIRGFVGETLQIAIVSGFAYCLLVPAGLILVKEPMTIATCSEIARKLRRR